MDILFNVQVSSDSNLESVMVEIQSVMVEIQSVMVEIQCVRG